MTIGYAIKKLLQVYNVPVFYWNSQYWNCRKAQRPKFNAKILTLKGPKKLVIGPNLGRGPRSGHPCCTLIVTPPFNILDITSSFSPIGRKPGARKENARGASARLHERTASGARNGDRCAWADPRRSRVAASCALRRPKDAGECWGEPQTSNH